MLLDSVLLTGKNLWHKYKSQITLNSKEIGPESENLICELKLEFELGLKFFCWYDLYSIASISGINFESVWLTVTENHTVT